MTTIRAIALVLLTGGKDKLPAADIQRYADILGVTTRSIYRYLDKVAYAKMLISQAGKPEKQ